ncbi:hypothetical protein ACRALDRAFT_1056424 [Sodiomyces alcalophilus JCM 7366]|uniref:uncharacterized protein n=1 Tax=Sodiomyces alcalophilus JCM 7366 TaxID=591952 RepID=UPI0039B6DB5D
MDHAREDFDDLAWDRNDEAREQSMKDLRRISTCRALESFVGQKFDKHATLVSPINVGGYNILYRLSLEGMYPDVMIRLPFPNMTQFPDEKTLREAATVKFLYHNTQLPIPRQFDYGLSSQNPDIGPFTILQHVENQGTLSDRLTTPNDDPDETHVLDPNIPESTLQHLCNDCRNKYVARRLFHNLAKQGRLSTYGFKDDDWSFHSKTQPSTISPAPPNSGSFRLWADDLRPGNILLNASDEIVALIDWEFTYAGPTQFILDPPWWLLLDVPEMWSSGIDDWAEVYSRRLETWLSAMKKAEESMGPASMPFVLSTYMRESWETGRFWLNYAARKSWAFDTIFWKYLDKRFFGDREDVPKHDLWKTRIHLLSEDEQRAMDPFVERRWRSQRRGS